MFTRHNTQKPVTGIQLRPDDHWSKKGLVCDLVMNERAGSTVHDLSGNGNHGTFNNDVSWVSGKFGPAIYIGGDNDYVNLGNDIPAFGTGDFTIAAWVRLSSSVSDANPCIISRGDASSGEWMFRVYHATTPEDKQLGFYGDAGNINLKAPAGSFTLDEWHHVVATRRNGYLRLFQDGVEVAGGSDSSNLSEQATDVRIGEAPDNLRCWLGEIDHLLIHTRALTVFEIAHLYGNPFCMFERDEISLLAASTSGRLGYLVDDDVSNDSTEFSNQRHIKRTSDGHLHCVYAKDDEDGQQIFHAESSDGGQTWSAEQLTTGIYTQKNAALEVKSDDTLHVVWEGRTASSSTNAQIRYMYYDGESWSGITEITSDSSYYQNSPSIAVDSNDVLHVSWFGKHSGSTTYSQIRYTYNNGSWQAIENLTSGNYNQNTPCIAIDNNDYIHIAFSGKHSGSESQDQIRHLLNNGSWQTVENVCDCAAQPYMSFAIDDNDYLYVGFCYSALKIVRNTGSWQSPETVHDGAGFSGHSDTDIAIDSTGQIHLLSCPLIIGGPPGTGYFIYYYTYTDSWSSGQAMTPNHDSIMPCFIHAQWPQINDVRTNRAKTGYGFIWSDEQEDGPPTAYQVRYYASNLTWDEAATYIETGLTVSASGQASISDVHTGVEQITAQAAGQAAVTDVHAGVEQVTVSADSEVSLTDIQAMVEQGLSINTEGVSAVTDYYVYSETITVQADGQASTTDVHACVDQVTVLADGEVSVTDVQAMVEQGLSISAEGVSSITDYYVYSEVITAQADGQAAITDVHTGIDQITVSADGEVSVTDVQGMVEQGLTITADGASSVTDTLAPLEVVTAQADGQAAVTDTHNCIDQVTVSADGQISLSDIQAMLDQGLSINAEGVSSVTDYYVYSEVITAQADGQAAITDVHTGIDQITVSADGEVSVTDVQGMVEQGLTITADGASSATDTLAPLEVVTAQAAGQAAVTDTHNCVEQVTVSTDGEISVTDIQAMIEQGLTVTAEGEISISDIQTMIEQLTIEAAAIADQSDTYIPVGGYVAAASFLMLKKHK